MFHIKRLKVVTECLTAIFASAGNALLSHEQLAGHAVVTAGVSATYTYAMHLQLQEMHASYKYAEQRFDTTCGIHDAWLIQGLAPVLYASLNVLLWITYTITAMYESESNPDDTTTKDLHQALSILCIVLPYLLNSYLIWRYPLWSLPDQGDFTNPSIKSHRKDAAKWQEFTVGLEKITSKSEMNLQVKKVFEQSGFNTVTDVIEYAPGEYAFSAKFQHHANVINL